MVKMIYLRLSREFYIRIKEKAARGIFYVLLIAGIISILSSPVFADTAAGHLLIVGPNPAAPLVLAPYSHGLALLGIIIIETILLRMSLKCSWLSAFLYSLYLNIISWIIGILIGLTEIFGEVIYIIVLLLLPIIGIFLINKLHAPRWFYLFVILLLSFVALFFAFCFLIYTHSNDSFIDSSVFISIIAIELLLLYGFGLTLIIEGLLLYALRKNPNIWKAVLYANIGSYLMLFILYPMIILFDSY